MGVREEQERPRDFLPRALEACPSPEQALAVAVRGAIRGISGKAKPALTTGRSPS